MEISNIKNVKEVEIVCDNLKIKATPVEIDTWGKIIFEVPEEHHYSTGEMGKRGEVFFQIGGKKYFISGRIFAQSPHRILMTPETDIEEDRRSEERFEVPSLPAKIKYKRGFFHHEEIRGTILELSLRGAKIETGRELKEDTLYELETFFPFRHKNLKFITKFRVKNSKPVRRLFVNGVLFEEPEYECRKNLEKYIKTLKHELGQDTLNY